MGKTDLSTNLKKALHLQKKSEIKKNHQFKKKPKNDKRITYCFKQQNLSVAVARQPEYSRFGSLSKQRDRGRTLSSPIVALLQPDLGLGLPASGREIPREYPNLWWDLRTAEACSGYNVTRVHPPQERFSEGGGADVCCLVLSCNSGIILDSIWSVATLCLTVPSR